MLKLRRLVAAAAGVALAAALTTPAMSQELHTMDFAVNDGMVQMVVFGSGYHVDWVAIHTITEPQGPAEYRFTYYATTGPTKAASKICGGSGTGGSCYQDFDINATYAGGIGIRSCGSIYRTDNNQNLGVACKDW
ncbi:hypothetical protein B0I33_10414 [Prauserella shujinwangii]|uniref:Uncharacterized protein n=1 Tax=Prauserella shujinwangii TaxID=1453103 RepID=A0A2T0LVZ6_9PSEU|nr:hypothetical protein [Prauserella shujinwangii]PRX48200.1 hypothetical protein B0I33_10414 [Prauserella shujinwangii]